MEFFIWACCPAILKGAERGEELKMVPKVLLTPKRRDTPLHPDHPHGDSLDTPWK